ncbi:phosphatase associated protein [Coprinopsis cinerea AmutBmut pab1-1]|nr:phosphatase associated protein [Coprinopsis cinerea AmutBmut pab1-1]
MFWRFGFNNGSSIDSLLDKDDVSLEALLDEDDLLQECKSQNTRLTEYFARTDVLKMLLGYVTGQTESEEKGRFKYPYIATEVLCSDIWSIVETCLQEQEQLLVPFWETVLDRPPEEMKTLMVMASHFSKVTSAFLTKKPAEMISFIQKQPNIVERLLQHIETSPFVDILVRIIQLDESVVGGGVLEWLSSQDFIGRLVDLLSPEHSSAVHSIVTDLIKGIISMATPSPTAGLTDGNSNGPASNRFARELAKRETMTKLVGFMLCKFDSLPDEDSTTGNAATATTSSSDTTTNTTTNNDNNKSSTTTTSSTEPKLPTRESATSSIVHSIAVVIELIRKNNSDYFEPYLFHTLRNRLIQVQQQIHSQGEDTRHALEEVMKEMVNRMGVVHLGPVLELACQHLDEFHKYLKEPRSLRGPISTTVGSITPLSLERYRILELLAELLHCSNMSLLNRPASYNHLYDSEGRLQGGLAALEELAAVIAMNNSNDRDTEPMDDEDDEDDDDDGLPPREDFPVRMVTHDSPTLDSDEEMDAPGSSDDDDMEEIAMYDEPRGVSIEGDGRRSPVPSSPPATPGSSTSGSPSMTSSAPTMEISAPAENLSSSPTSTSSLSDEPTRRSLGRRPQSSRRSSRRRTLDSTASVEVLPIGEQLKKQFLEMNLFSTLLDLFFEFPWNNFLHSTVYDLIHQVLTGNVESGRNRDLAISLFKDAKIMHRIVEGQARNDRDVSTTKGGRLGYMGHLTLIAEDVISALEHFPPELRLTIIQYAPEEEWDRYVKGRYKETKANDTKLLGGGKPAVSSRNMSQWKVDEDELGGEGVRTKLSPAGGGGGMSGHMREQAEEDGGGIGAGPSGSGSGGMKSEFRRVASGSDRPRNTAHFLPSSLDEDDDEDEDSTRASHFARYLEQEIHSSDQFNSSDEEDEDEGWLSQSAFAIREQPVSSLHSSVDRRPLSAANVFDDVFEPRSTTSSSDPFPQSAFDDDGFGPFSDASNASGSSASGGDPFSFSSSSLSEDMDDDLGSFDFGDFQTAEVETGTGDSDLLLTPTSGGMSGSWTFTSAASTSSSTTTTTTTTSGSGSVVASPGVAGGEFKLDGEVRGEGGGGGNLKKGSGGSAASTSSMSDSVVSISDEEEPEVVLDDREAFGVGVGGSGSAGAGVKGGKDK